MLNKSNKFFNKKTIVDGIKFDSKREATRYSELVILEKYGIISELRIQQVFVVLKKQKGEREVKYISDFTYYENGVLVVEDVKSKSTITPLYVIKRKLMLKEYGISIREVY